MMNVLTLEHDEQLTPEAKAQILAEVLRFMATRMEPVPYGALLAHVISHFGSREELVGAQVMYSCMLLLVAGLVKSNTFHIAGSGVSDVSFEIGSETRIGPPRPLTCLAYGAPET